MEMLARNKCHIRKCHPVQSAMAVGLVVVGDRSSCNRQIVFADVDSTQQFMC